MEFGFILQDGTEVPCDTNLEHEKVAREYLSSKGIEYTGSAEKYMISVLGAIQLGAQTYERIVRYDEGTQLTESQKLRLNVYRKEGYLVDNGVTSTMYAAGRTGAIHPITKKFVYNREGD